MAYCTSIPWMGATIVVILFCQTVIRSISYRIALSKNGCSKPPKYRHKDIILGLDLFVKRVKAIKAGNTRSVDAHIFGTYGKTVETISWGKREIVTMDPKNIQAVLATHVDKFGSEPLNRAVCQPLIGDGIITTDGALWKRSRQLVNPIFARAQVSDLSTFEVHVQHLLALIPRNGSTIDMQPLLKLLFLDTSTEFIFGESANALSPETSTLMARRLPVVFDEALRGMRTRFLLGKFRFLRGRDRKWKRDCAEVHAIVETYIDRAIEQHRSSKESLQSKTPSSYVLLNELAKESDNRLYIRNEVLNVFFPGRDTAAAYTGNTIFLLSRHPEVWRKLRTEVLALGDQKLTFELLKSMKYMQWVLNEVLRILSPVSRSWKTCLATCTLPRGGGPSGSESILMQPGDQVDMTFSAMHVDPDIWGPDAKVFRPERWDGLKQSWEYIPFLGGRRICPAQQNVLTEVAYILVRLMQMFSVCVNRDECLEYVEAMVFTLESENGIKVAFLND